MTEINVAFTEDEARALVPWKGSDHTAGEWNHRLDLAEDAISKIRAALREQGTPELGREQGTLGGLAA